MLCTSAPRGAQDLHKEDLDVELMGGVAANVAAETIAYGKLQFTSAPVSKRWLLDQVINLVDAADQPCGALRARVRWVPPPSARQEVRPCH